MPCRRKTVFLGPGPGLRPPRDDTYEFIRTHEGGNDAAGENEPQQGRYIKL